MRCELRPTRVSKLAMLGYLIAVCSGLFFGVPEITSVGFALGLVTLGVIVGENLQLGGTLHDTFDIVAGSIGLKPIGSPAPEATPAQAA